MGCVPSENARNPQSRQTVSQQLSFRNSQSKNNASSKEVWGNSHQRKEHSPISGKQTAKSQQRKRTIKNGSDNFPSAKNVRFNDKQGYVQDKLENKTRSTKEGLLTGSIHSVPRAQSFHQLDINSKIVIKQSKSSRLPNEEKQRMDYRHMGDITFNNDNHLAGKSHSKKMEILQRELQGINQEECCRIVIEDSKFK